MILPDHHVAVSDAWRGVYDVIARCRGWGHKPPVLGVVGGRKTRHFRAIFPGRPPGGVQVSRSCLVR